MDCILETPVADTAQADLPRRNWLVIIWIFEVLWKLRCESKMLRTSFALSYQLLRLISICGLAAVSMAFRANGGLAFIASAINLIEPLNTRNYTESLISVCFRAFRG